MSNSTQLRFLQGRYGHLPSTFYPLALPIAFSLYVLLQTTLLAQAPKGAIRGVVKDVTGAVVTKTSVRVSQPHFGAAGSGGRMRTDST